MKINRTTELHQGIGNKFKITPHLNEVSKQICPST